MSFQESHNLNITVVGPDDAPAMALPIPIIYKETRGSDNFYSASPEQPELAYPTDGNSSGGCSTPITPFTTLLELSAVDTHLSPTEHDYHGLSTPLSPFSPSTLSPSFDGLTLSDGYSTHENSMFNSNDKNMQIPSLDFTGSGFQDDSGFNTTHPSLSLVIPPQSVGGADNNSDFKDIFQFDESDPNLTAVEQTLSPSYQFPIQETLPTEPNLQRVHRVAAHNRGFSVAGTSWTAPSTASTAHLTSPSLCFTPSDYNNNTNSSSLLSPPTPYGGEDVFLGNGTTTVQRRHSHTGGRSSSRAPERGRSDMRSHATSASSSRRSSPYPSPLLPTHSPDTLSPSQIWDCSDKDLLAVPQDGGAAISRRHSFTGYSTHSAPPPYEMQQQHQHQGGLSQLPFHDEDATSPGGSALRKVASQAGINASVKRRTKEAKFACDWCQQTFTTNHNLKNHRNVHLGIKEHSCARCGRDFTTQSVLARHMKTCKAPASS